MRGIRNTSGVSCHISSALQLLYHGLPEMREILLLIATVFGNGFDNSNGSPLSSGLFLSECARLWRFLSKESDKPVNPMPLYRALPSLNYQQLGDAAMTLRVLILTLQQAVQEKQQSSLPTPPSPQQATAAGKSRTAALKQQVSSTFEVQRRLEQLLREVLAMSLEITTSQLILGIQGRCKRIKKKSRTFMGPLAVPLNPGGDSINTSGIPTRGDLRDSIATVSIHLQPIQGYNWNLQMGEYHHNGRMVPPLSNPVAYRPRFNFPTVREEEQEEASCSTTSSEEFSECSDDVSVADSVASSLASFSSVSTCASSVLSSVAEEFYPEYAHWRTYKTQHFTSLPRHLLLHIKRFEHGGGERTIIDQETQLKIPLDLDMKPFCNPREYKGSCQCLSYAFSSAILYSNQATTSSIDNEQEGGHYACLTRKGSEWILLDDDDAIVVQEEEANEMLCIRCDGEKVQRSPRRRGSRQHKWCAIVVLYSRECTCVSPIQEALNQLRLVRPRPTPASSAPAPEKSLSRKDSKHQECLMHQPRRPVHPSSAASARGLSKPNSGEKISLRNLLKREASASGPANKSILLRTNPSAVVGWRLKVRWSGDKHYPGVVALYNEKTGKHRVHYDDGDVRDYFLRKKTFEWLEDE